MGRNLGVRPARSREVSPLVVKTSDWLIFGKDRTFVCFGVPSEVHTDCVLAC